MPEIEPTDLLARAKENEKKYKWIAAIGFHKKALEHMLQQDNLLRAGEVAERIGYCYHRAAMQAKSRDEFEKRMKLAIEAYHQAQEFYARLSDQSKTGVEFRNKAIRKYLNYWLASGGDEKRKLLDDCLEFEDKALTTFESEGNMSEYCRTYNSLWLVFYLRGFLEWDRQALLRLVQKGMEWGEKALSMISEVDNPYEVAWDSFVYGSCLSFIASIEGIGVAIIEVEEAEENHSKAIAVIEKALFLSKRIDDSFLAGLSHLWLGYHMGLRSASQTHYEKALELGFIAQDHFLIGLSQAAMAHLMYWQSCTDPAKGVKSLEAARDLYDKSEQHNSIIGLLSHTAGELVAPQGYSAYFREKAIGWGSDPQKRVELLKMAKKAAVKAVKIARRFDLPRAIAGSVHCLSYSLAELARFETDLSNKRNLLKKVIVHRERFIGIMRQVEPFGHFSIGVGWSHLAENKARLAEIEPNLRVKEQLLKEAVSHSEESLELLSKVIPHYEQIGDFAHLMVLGRIIDRFEAALTDLHGLTKQSDILRRTIKLLHSSITLARKQGIVGLEAVSYWKIARAQDALEEYLEATESFKRASESYAIAAERLPQLKDFYEDYAVYMQAWSEIERAKAAHFEEQYLQAKIHYEKAALLHKSTTQWSCYSANYLAWAKLEAAEELSRSEKPEEAKKNFLNAVELFEEAGKSLQTKMETPLTKEEKELANALLKASEKRGEYCLGRIVLEEARIQERKGDHLQSSRKYGLAAKIFERMTEGEKELSRKQLMPLFYLCQAWQKMMLGEATMSSTAYEEAAELFKKAREHSLDQKASLLALANSCFCKALASGTEFEITRNLEAYANAKKHMEAAENCYLKAGYGPAAEYAKATLTLLDAYIYTTKAETETHPAEKAKYYSMAEKTLKTSVDSYLRAKYPEKSAEVQRLLENVVEKRKLTVSMITVLSELKVTSTTKSFSAPTPTHEQAVGFERFEHAELEGNLVISKEATVEEQIELKLDIVNVGREPGLLIRLEGLIHPGFKVTSSSPHLKIQGDLINMKGKRIDPLKVESIELTMQSMETGIFDLKPRVSYVDEAGSFKQCFLKPASLSIYPKLQLEFRTRAAGKVFEYLVKSFVEDYMRRRLVLEKAGWRSYVQIIKNVKISSRKIYGSKDAPGSAISELRRRGLIDTRIFLGERGRGGKIVKTRICYDKEVVKRLVDQKVAKNE